MTQYSYPPLDERNSEIRLITLLPSTDRDSPVICDITVARLAEDDMPPYEALSYTWGSAESPCKLRVSSRTEEYIDITRNLAEALPYLRDFVTPRVLWIDAIAINQQDIAERSEQVRRMADIFSMAERVVVWLGLADAHSKIAMQTCTTLYERVDAHPSRIGVLKSRGNNPVHLRLNDVRELHEYDEITCQSIACFLRRAWFHRLWIWQEIQLAKPGTLIACGSDTMPWTHLTNLLMCFISGVRSPEASITIQDFHVPVQNAINLSRNVDGRLIHTLLYRTRNTLCADPRDRVYAIIGLLRKKSRAIELKPDYKKSVAEVYLDFTMYVIKHFKTLEILHLCAHGQTTDPWPSWVPDLENFNIAYPFHRSTATLDTRSYVGFKPGRVLQATGLQIDKITMVDTVYIATESIKTRVRRWTGMLDLDEAYVDGKPVAEAFCRAVCSGRMADSQQPPLSRYPDMRLSLHAILKNLGGQIIENEIQSREGLFWSRCDRFRDAKQFFRSCKGYIGLGPLGLQEEDQICLLLGFTVPLIVRPHDDGTFKIIGQSYIAGLEAGEGLLGPLPESYRMVTTYHEASQAHYTGFLDPNTGKVRREDPRLDPELPEGWQRGNYDTDDGCYPSFFHKSDPGRWTELDPRLKKSELLKRGVSLVDIKFS